MPIRNLVRLVLLLALLSVSRHAHAHESSIFSQGKEVYQMHYSTHINVSPKTSDEEYLRIATLHTNYLVGAIAYIKDADNQNANGAPLRKKGDIKVSSITKNTDGSIDLQYSYDGEVVLDREDMTAYTLYLPEKLEAIDKLDGVAIGNCSLGAYAKTPDIFPVYWTPFNKYCEVPYITVAATLAPIVMKTTYPDYPRLAKDGVIQTAVFVGKMNEKAVHNPYKVMGRDESRSEYLEIVRDLKSHGFVRTEVIKAENLDTSYQETFEATIGDFKFVVKMVYGNSVYFVDGQIKGITDFYDQYLKIAKESAFVVYSGHAGFMVQASGTGFYDKKQLKLDADRYQIFVMNGCQTNDYIYPMFALKGGSKNLDMFINARESIVNPLATTAMMDAMVTWARNGTWTSYPTLVSKMDSVDAMLGVVGEQDNPVAPYRLSQ